MTEKTLQDLQLWRRTLAAVVAEVGWLGGQERAGLREEVAAVASLQRRLHAFFEKADGAELCRTCSGACCEKGRNHLTLVNLLGYLLADEAPPQPDFSSTCPFLGHAGCLLDPGRRPFNCVTFICDPVEANLTAAEVETFYALEKELRSIYLHFDRRYAGSSLRGLLIRAERLGGRDFLGPA